MPFDFGKVKQSGGANPLTMAEYKEHLRIDGNDCDADLTAKMAEALAWCENQTGRQFLRAVWKVYFDRFPGGGLPQLLPFGQLASVDAIDYQDTAGSVVSLNAAAVAAAYVVSTGREPGRICPLYGTTWPAHRRALDSVVYTISVGWADTASVDPNAKALLKLAIGGLWEFRESASKLNLYDVPGAHALVESLQFEDFVDYDPANSYLAG